MSLLPCVSLGAYQVLALIGAGGMGEIYFAHDQRLKRDIAIKVLPSKLIWGYGAAHPSSRRTVAVDSVRWNLSA